MVFLALSKQATTENIAEHVPGGKQILHLDQHGGGPGAVLHARLRQTTDGAVQMGPAALALRRGIAVVGIPAVGDQNPGIGSR